MKVELRLGLGTFYWPELILITGPTMSGSPHPSRFEPGPRCQITRSKSTKHTPAPKPRSWFLRGHRAANSILRSLRRQLQPSAVLRLRLQSFPLLYHAFSFVPELQTLPVPSLRSANAADAPDSSATGRAAQNTAACTTRRFITSRDQFYDVPSLEVCTAASLSNYG
jgi:hypothetical protein